MRLQAWVTKTKYSLDSCSSKKYLENSSVSHPGECYQGIADVRLFAGECLFPLKKENVVGRNKDSQIESQDFLHFACMALHEYQKPLL
jgi:hypothetical protein